ncbi:MAG: hypothetical protein ACAI25_20470, partial [Planctomycetota bacterium]
FRYFTRKNLQHALDADPEKWIDQDVTVTDELAYVFPTDPKGELDTEKTQGTKHVRFDTVYFRCAIPDAKKGDYLEAIWADAVKGCKDILDEIQAVNADERLLKDRKMDKHEEKRKELVLKLHARLKAKPLVTVYGKVQRADFTTPGFYLQKNASEEPKAKPEPITIICERVEKPRDRYYEFGLDDDND